MRKYILMMCVFLITIYIFLPSVVSAQGLPKPGTSGWRSLSIEKRREACNIPGDKLAMLSTDELLQKCLEYQFMSDILFTYQFKTGLDAIAKNFNGLRELFKRADAADAVMKYYAKLDPMQINTYKSSIEKGKFIYTFVFLELYLTQPVILDQLKGKERNVIKRIVEKINICLDVNSSANSYVYSMFPLHVKGLLIAVLLENMNDAAATKNFRMIHPEYHDLIKNLDISNLSTNLFNDILKRASEL